jgi:hypothetical protein
MRLALTRTTAAKAASTERNMAFLLLIAIVKRLFPEAAEEQR